PGPPAGIRIHARRAPALPGRDLRPPARLAADREGAGPRPRGASGRARRPRLSPPLPRWRERPRARLAEPRACHRGRGRAPLSPLLPRWRERLRDRLDEPRAFHQGRGGGPLPPRAQAPPVSGARRGWGGGPRWRVIEIQRLMGARRTRWAPCVLRGPRRGPF